MKSRYSEHMNVTSKQIPGTIHGPVTLVTSKSKLPTLKVGEYFLHSSYDPVKEAKKLAEVHYKKNHFHILFGFGLGYLAREVFARMGDNECLLIIEPNQQVMQLALETADSSTLIQDSKVIFNDGSDLSTLAQCLRSYMREGFLGRIRLIESPNYTELYPELAREIAELVKECSMLELINVNTLHVFSRKWQENYLFNLLNAMSAKPFSFLVNKLSCPVIVAAAGPSLTKQLPLLRTLRNKAFILCAGSAINSLLQGGVKPHAVVTVDGGEANYNHFKDLNIDSVLLIYSLLVHKEIPCKHSGVQVVFNDTNSKLTQWTNQVLQRDLGPVRGGASVANYCLDIACRITSGPVCLIGQDLAYTGNKTHATGNKNETELDLEQVKHQKKFIRVKGYYGDLVLTDYIFLSMKKTFEYYIEFLRNQGDIRPIINATEGGVMLEGTQNMSFNDFIRSYCVNDHVDEIEALFVKNNSDSPNWRNLARRIKIEKNKVLSVIKLCEKAQKEFVKIDPDQLMTVPNVFARLDKLDKKLISLLENELMYSILRPVIFRVQHRYLETESETPEGRAQRVLAKSAALYQEISEVAGHTEKYIDDLLDKIKTHLDV